MRVLGIDEAGRGCVFGPLVVAGFVVDDVDPLELIGAGAGDSKGMSAKKRDAARVALVELGTPDVREISAIDIDGGNLNTLEEETIADLVRTHRPDRVEIDALGPPSAIPRVIERLNQLVGDGVEREWLMEPKADVNHPVVGAASVFAKTTRDARLEALKQEFGQLGSGYPSDPAVKKWLADWHASGVPWPAFVRTRWSTVTAFAQQRLL